MSATVFGMAKRTVVPARGTVAIRIALSGGLTLSIAAQPLRAHHDDMILSIPDLKNQFSLFFEVTDRSTRGTTATDLFADNIGSMQGSTAENVLPVLKTLQHIADELKICSTDINILMTDGGEPLQYFEKLTVENIGADPVLRARLIGRYDVPSLWLTLV